jgi:Mrp family chromosome partitioning ATPase
MAAKFDVVLLDTPPALPTSDAQIIAAEAGNALMLARADHTRRANLLSLMASLKRAKVNVVGSVVNSYTGNGLFNG